MTDTIPTKKTERLAAWFGAFHALLTYAPAWLFAGGSVLAVTAAAIMIGRIK
jgi:hypothetical protein